MLSVVEIELRDYRIRRGHMDAWIAGWTAGVVPLRQEAGFHVIGAWVDRQNDRFVWLIGHAGSEGFEVANNRYYDSNARASLRPEPSGLIEQAVKTRVESVLKVMPDFTADDLSGSRFERVDLTGAEFRDVDLSHASFGGVNFSGASMRGVEMVDVRIDGEIQNLLVNGVDVAPLVNAELDRREPNRAKMRPLDAAGFVDAWDIIERLWNGTVERARGLEPGMLHVSVDGEWSFIETLRHLVFATDAWVRRAILGDPSPWDPLDLPWDEMPDTPGIPRDRQVRPSLDQVLVLRRDRMATVRTVIDGLTEASLATRTQPVEGPGWPPPESFEVRECLLIVLNEEWHHRQFAERDLAILEADARRQAT